MHDTPLTPGDARLAALLAQREWVQRLARGLVADVHAADDVAQQALTSALARPPRHASNLRSWLGSLVRSRARDAARAQTRRQRREVEASCMARESGPTPEQALERAELVQQLATIVVGLREPYRSALVLVYFEGLAPLAAAQRLRLNESTLRTQVKRGLELVREELDRSHRGRRDAWLAGVGVLALERSSRAALASSTVGTGTAIAVGGGLVKWKSIVAAVLVLALGAFLVARRASRPSRGAELAAQPGAPIRLSDTPALPAIEPSTRTALQDSSAAPVASAAVSTTRLDVDVVWQRDGTPAVGVGVLAVHWDESRRSQYVDALTDGAGRAVFDSLRPGKIVVFGDRGGREEVELALGATAHVRLEIPKGITVAGRVELPDGSAVADAEIFGKRSGVFWPAHPLGRSDASGRFELRDLQAELSTAIWARHAAHAPSHAVNLRSDGEDEREIVLTLLGEGGGVSVHVVDPAGAAVERARVLVGAGRPHAVTLPDGRQGSIAAACNALTDEEGRCSFRGVGLGAQEVQVLAEGFPELLARVDVRAGASDVLELTLERGARLSGRVIDADGAPASGATVQTAEWTRPGFRNVVTDALGCFSLDGLPPGKLAIRADGDARGRRRGEVELRAGEEARVELALERGNVVEGRVLDARDQPLAGWRVHVECVQDHFSDAQLRAVMQWVEGKHTLTDAEGRFVFANVPSVRVRIEVRGADLESYGQPLAMLTDLQVPARDLVVRVDPSASPSGWIAGVIADEDGKPLGDVPVWATVASGGEGQSISSVRTQRESGRFRIGPLPAGMYEVRADPSGHPRIELGFVNVEREGEVDVGVRRAGAAGTVELKLANVAVERLAHIELQLRGEDDEVESLVKLVDRARSQPLKPGEYVLSVIVDGRRVKGREVMLFVSKGEVTEKTVDLAGL